jgi:putative FmdB family regulatory protein
MPFYEYECPHCGYDEEVLQQITDKPLTKCPSCGKKGLRKLISAPVFRLKGSGWYETDFKSDKENKRNLHGADKEDSAAAKPDDAKPDGKPESSKAESSKTESAKPDAPKPDTPKPVAAKPAVKPVKRARSKHKGARRGRR